MISFKTTIECLLIVYSGGLKAVPKPKMIGVDYGLRRIGVGVGAGWASRPLSILEHCRNDTRVCLDLVKIAKSESASSFVVGLPLEKNGSESQQSNLTRTFAQRLIDISAQCLPRAQVILWDERFSSQEAEALVAHSRSPPEFIDSIAACSILDDYYAHQGVGAELLFPSPNVTAILNVRRSREEADRHESGTTRRQNLPSKRALKYLD